ncbi:NADH:ubiquinone oxidoreductase subunit 1 {chain H} [Geoglobus ahangari]|uniref:NADH:ubiquinone oxidoreductase subunit 1 (chain H) n=1 Tax=Geoglobus ahangari TaxID=113653 RepID=A0A0F7IF92_9EURY|nr:NADH-quinone oxidoreductase subunit NuoH [Geoglobus ahangari]AKG92308.1 NADH:ubiquinone oxidoreductase subunit 1 {chain H} [Geoglobus ahangari]
MAEENVVFILLEKILSTFTKNLVNIPAINPLVERLLDIPFLNVLVAFLLWKPIFHVLILPGMIGLTLVLLFIIYFERKITARVQWRVGPKEVSRRTGGVIQALADGMRYFFQEVIVHRDAHAFYFLQFPLISFLPVLLPLLFLPAGGTYGIKSLYAIPIAMALISLIPVFIIAMGWASNSKFAYIGSVREAFMYFAYEIPFILAVVAMILIYQTADPFEIVAKQSIPGVFINPIAFLAFFITVLIATSRLPFDIPEADQEVAFGPYVEYSGILFGLTMMLPYEKLYLLSMLSVILFFGGWNGPAIAPLGDLAPVIWLYIKTIVFMCVVSLARSIYARYRLDQTLKMGWSVIMSMALIALFISAGWVAWLRL